MKNVSTDYHYFYPTMKVKLESNAKINLALNNTVPAIYADVGENELRYAMGDYESFVTNLLSTNTGTTLYNYYKDIGVTVTDIVRHGAMAGAGGRRVGAAADDESGEPDSQILRDAQTLHSWLHLQLQK